ncbi:MAG: 5-oxoprolinase subunit PxpB [Verrucomicrobia bacterium]|nr:5-oxoprolinase subunit PxpB [Verrucomicrobiota bacterium]MBI3868988.1 5-oxoprolinase subunit PxpB [Verrucomicrobiota bacterium]
MRWLSYGPNALLFHFAERPSEAAFLKGRAIVRDLETNPAPGVVDFVPGFTSILILFSPALVPDPRRHALEWIARLKSATSASLPPPETRLVPVRYDGPDLERVAERAKLSVQQTIEAHSGAIYRVYTLGFAPGFAYLGDLDPRLHTPRLATPRPRVPAGSVGIGGEHTGVYPLETAGGWNLIGRTSLRLFDPDRAEASRDPRNAFLLKSGDRVRFVPQ